MNPGARGQAEVGTLSASQPFGLWGRAFRPFFLGVGIYGSLLIPWWTLIWLGKLPATAWLIPIWWHGHEMVFGFVAAAIAGFLLTASPVWSGGPALTGRPLAAVFTLWVAGRIALSLAGVLPLWFVAAIDVAFLPVVGLAVMRTLWGSGQWRNYAVVGVVAILALANLMMHAEALGIVSGVAGRALRFAVDFVVVLVLVIGGRITPAFTGNAFRRSGSSHEVRTWKSLDVLLIGSAAGLAVAGLLTGRTALTGVLAVVAGLAAAGRLVGWRSIHTRGDPLLWSLHAGAAWLVVGLLLVGASDLGVNIPPSVGLHALTAGAIGATVLAVMTRVGLGHTGRALELPGSLIWAYAFVHGAALARVSAPFISGVGYQALLVASTVAWVAAFMQFTIAYWSILTTPRPDGRPG